MHLRRTATFAVVGALALAGCGDDATETAQDAGNQAEQAAEGARTQAEEAVQQGGEFVDPGGEAVETWDPQPIEDTRDVVDQVTRSAERLAQDPDANVDAELADAEQRARDLAERAESEFQGERQEFGQALSSVNERLADTAADLQEITDPEEARQVIEEDLGEVANELRSATESATEGQQVPDDVRRQLEQARDRVEELQRELPSIGG